jgi:hypothetical protein
MHIRGYSTQKWVYNGVRLAHLRIIQPGYHTSLSLQFSLAEDAVTLQTQQRLEGLLPGICALA